MMRALLTGLALLLPVAVVAAPQSATIPWTDQRPQARGGQLLRDDDDRGA